MPKSDPKSIVNIIITISFKCIVDLNIKPKTTEFLKENIGQNFYDLNLVEKS